MHAISWGVAGPAIAAAFVASLVEVVEAFTIVLAVATLRGWRPATLGTLVALLVLALLVVALGPLLDRVPLHALQLTIGVLLLLFGMGWLRKAILRSAGVLAAARRGRRLSRRRRRLSAKRRRASTPRSTGSPALPPSRPCSWKGSKSSSSSSRSARGAGSCGPPRAARSPPASRFSTAGIVIHKPLSKVPENTLKFGVGVMLSAFGVFWTGEGLGVEWPGADLALLVLVAAFLATGLRRRRCCARSGRRSGRVMTLIRDIASELAGMFLADARLSAAILLLVVLVAALVAGLGVQSPARRRRCSSSAASPSSSPPPCAAHAGR